MLFVPVDLLLVLLIGSCALICQKPAPVLCGKEPSAPKEGWRVCGSRGVFPLFGEGLWAPSPLLVLDLAVFVWGSWTFQKSVFRKVEVFFRVSLDDRI